MIPDEPARGRPSDAIGGLLDGTPGWLSGGGASADVVLSSRVRLARNIAGFRFVGRADVSERNATLALVREQLGQVGLLATTGGRLGGPLWFDLHELDKTDREALAERHLVSRQHARGLRVEADDGGVDPRAVALLSASEGVSVMVNEEDHLRLQAVAPGLALGEACDELDAVDDRVESVVDYAFSPRFGYLTACPTNVGTGIRVSVMLHLPALRIMGDIEKVERSAADMSLALRGFWGEGSEAAGDFYQLSNQTTLGKSERMILSELERVIVPRVVDYERRAREKLLAGRRLMTEDLVFRALGTLTHARRLKADEAMKLLSELRLGVELGLIESPTAKTINRLLLLVHPVHLQHALGKGIEGDRLRSARATLVRERLGEAR